MYLEQAYKGKNEWWRYLITFIIVVIAKILSEIPISIIASKKAIENNELDSIVNYLTDPKALEISDNYYFLLMFGPMVVVFSSIVICMHLVHGLTLTQVFTSYKKFRWKNFFVAASLWLVLLMIVEIVSYSVNPDNYSFYFSGKDFFILLAMSLVFVPFQASAEELYFRGNLYHGIGVLFKSRIAPIILTSCLFGIMHFKNPEVKEFGLVPAMIQYIGFGLLLGVVVVMDGGLEMAFGMHTINNFYLLCFVSYSGSVIKTESLFHTKEVNILVSTIGFLVVALIYLFILKKLFKWKSLKWLVKPLENPGVKNEAF